MLLGWTVQAHFKQLLDDVLISRMTKGEASVISQRADNTYLALVHSG